MDHGSHFALGLAFAFAFADLAALPGSAAEGPDPKEKARIEALISHVEGLKGAKFIRNGGEYDSKTAGRFLRGKWKDQEKAIHTAADFIALAGTRSSSTGKPYLIRLEAAEAVPCADYLKERLRRLEDAPAKGPDSKAAEEVPSSPAK